MGGYKFDIHLEVCASHLIDAAVATDSFRYSIYSLMNNLFTCFFSRSLHRPSSVIFDPNFTFNASFTASMERVPLWWLLWVFNLVCYYCLVVCFFSGRYLIELQPQSSTTIDRCGVGNGRKEHTTHDDVKIRRMGNIVSFCAWSRLLKLCVNLFHWEFVWKWAKEQPKRSWALLVFITTAAEEDIDWICEF